MTSKDLRVPMITKLLQRSLDLGHGWVGAAASMSGITQASLEIVGRYFTYFWVPGSRH